MEKGDRVRVVDLDIDDDEFYSIGAEGVIHAVTGNALMVTFDKGKYLKDRGNDGDTWYVNKSKVEKVED